MYQAEINRSQPACLLLLVDHSYSMSDKWAGTGMSLAEQLALAVNRLLGNAVLLCSKGDDRVYDYFEVGIIGYGDVVQPILHGSSPARPMVPVSELAHNPLRVDRIRRKVPDGAGGVVEVEMMIPVWVEPVANGITPMSEAVRMAEQVLRTWCATHPDSFPPLVINVTDGDSTDGDPRQAAAGVRATATRDGNTLMFNVHLSGASRKAIEFPEDAIGLDALASKLFEMSSVLPPTMLEAAQSKTSFRIGPKSRGFLYNAEATNMIDFLDIGTRAVTPTGLRELTAGPGSMR